MDWKTKLVLPPNYVTLQHLKELRTKELQLKLRQEAEAEYKSRLQEEERKRRTDEEKKIKEEEEEERLRRESIRREEIIQVMMIKDGNLKEEGKKKKKKNRRWGKKKKDTLELEPQTQIKSSAGGEVIPDKGNIYKNTRQRKSGSKGGIVVDEIVMNQKLEEEIERKIGDLNVDDDKKMKSKQFLPTQAKIEHQFRIQNIRKHGIYVHNPRNASCSSLVWMPKQI